MEIFKTILHYFVLASLAFAVIEAYLTINKIWLRKHEKVVAESISISAQLLAVGTGLPYAIHYLLDEEWEGAADTILFLLVNGVLFSIGIGLWVEGNRNKGFFALLRKALRLERTEASALLKNFFKPAGADRVIDILIQLAMIDKDFDERERSFIRTFADNWHIDFNKVMREVEKHTAGGGFVQLRDSVQKYLSMSPPQSQAEQFRDVLQALIKADKKVTEEEELISAELTGMLDDYIGGTQSAPFTVVLAPQNDAQKHACRDLLPGVSEENLLGGVGYRAGQFYSRNYARMMADKYRDLGILTVVEGEEPEVEEIDI
ncbi:MAG: hypothetical protein KDK35_16135 [Leptospiraceae bacterium]|nr:hypothetical protein [Leptospiraceae bacterium]